MPTDVIQFPSERIVYGNINPVSPNTGSEPLFVSDVQIAVQQAFDAAMAALGINPTTDIFYIISGLNYSGGIYSSGVIYFRGASGNGQFYAVNSSFAEGNALIPDTPTESFNRLYGDNLERYTYATYTASPATVGTGTTIAFSGNMNAYRIGSKYLQGAITALQAITAALGTAANLNWSATPLNGTVPIWDSVYAKNQVLPLTGGTLTGALTLNADPSTALGASTKQYVDNNFVKILAKGYTNLGAVPSGVQNYVIPLGTTIGVDYKVVASIVNNNGSNAECEWYIDNTYSSKTTGFKLYIHCTGSTSADIYFDWFVIAR